MLLPAAQFLEAQLLATELAQDRLFGNHGSSHSMLEKIPFWLLQQGAVRKELHTRLGSYLFGS